MGLECLVLSYGNDPYSETCDRVRSKLFVPLLFRLRSGSCCRIRIAASCTLRPHPASLRRRSRIAGTFSTRVKCRVLLLSCARSCLLAIRLGRTRVAVTLPNKPAALSLSLSLYTVSGVSDIVHGLSFPFKTSSKELRLCPLAVNQCVAPVDKSQPPYVMEQPLDALGQHRSSRAKLTSAHESFPLGIFIFARADARSLRGGQGRSPRSNSLSEGTGSAPT